MTNGLVWLRGELRLHDNPLLQAAAACDRLLLVYVIEDSQLAPTDWGWPRRHAHRWRFLAQSLQALAEQLEALGQRLLVLCGDSARQIATLVAAHDIDQVFVNDAPGSEEAGQLQRLLKLLDQTLPAGGSKLITSLDNRLYPQLPIAAERWPMSFSAFRRKVEKRLQPQSPCAVITRLPPPLLEDVPVWPQALMQQSQSESLSSPPRFCGGEQAGLQRLQHYLHQGQCILNYKQTRNGMLHNDDSSKLSPWLADGSLSVRHVWAEIERFEADVSANESTYWLKFELLWREYFRWLLQHTGNALFRFVGLRDQPIHGLRAFDRFDQRQHEQFAAWTQGATGIPMIDANMRELQATGYMSNRGRQNVASFLVKDLQLDWRAGAAWFEHLLLDYDVASNWGNWAYQAGVGTDTRARWFNVVEQSRRYDPKTEYISHWCPELAELPIADRFAPWAASTAVPDYPASIMLDPRW
ncbi:MAG: DASH family cryptochrome [Gammaproteobacteria bacterium]|nr:DASH family cryptochrome [Gammaproteobacteria bacterium]